MTLIFNSVPSSSEKRRGDSRQKGSGLYVFTDSYHRCSRLHWDRDGNCSAASSGTFPQSEQRFTFAFPIRHKPGIEKRRSAERSLVPPSCENIRRTKRCQPSQYQLQSCSSSCCTETGCRYCSRLCRLFDEYRRFTQSGTHVTASTNAIAQRHRTHKNACPVSCSAR